MVRAYFLVPSNDPWSQYPLNHHHNLPPLHRYDLLRCLNEEEGLIAEATFQTHFGALPSMTAAVKALHDKPGTRTLQLGLEEFQEQDFDGAVRRIYAFFGFPDDEVSGCVDS